MKNVTRTLMLGTALSFPLAGFVNAQTLENMSEEDLRGKSAECRSLVEVMQSGDLPALIPVSDLTAAVEEDSTEDCVMLTRTISDERERLGATTAEDSATAEVEDSETVTEELDLSEDATIEGQARVTVPEPDVDVQVPAPNVTVMKQLPRVTVNETPLDIQIAQKQPNVEVEIPEIIVRVDIPAPDVYILSSDPEVSVSTADPQVQVEQGEPTVSVTQRDPELNVDLGVDPEGTAQTDTAQNAVDAETDGDANNVAGNTEVARTEPQVAIQQAEGEPNVTVEGGDPAVSYEKSEPKISVVMANQPTVDVQQGGEPNVVIETAQEREQRLSTQNQPATEQAAVQEDVQEQQNQNVVTATVDELTNMDVLTSDGENLGQPSGIIERDGQTVLVLSSGGFLGLGAKEVPVPMDRVTVQDGALVVETMSEEEVEEASGFNFDDEQRLEGDRTIEVNRM